MDALASKSELVELLAEVRRRNIEIYLGEKTIRYRGPKSQLDPEIKERISALGNDLEEFLSRQPTYSYPKIEISHPEVDKNVVIQIQTGKRRCGLFCIHSITGLASFYRHLAPGLGRDYPMFGINAVDTRFERPPISDICEMARYYADQIQLVQESGPYFICGLSMGGLIALEMAKTLAARGEQVGWVALLDTRLPGKGRDTIPDTLHEQPAWVWLTFIGMRVSRDVVQQYRSNVEFWRMPLAKQLGRLSKDASRYSPALFGENCSSETIEKFLQSFVALLKSQARYRPEEYHGRIVYFLADEERTSDGKHPSYLSQWPEVAKGEFEIVSTPGNHTSMVFNEKNAISLGKKIRSYLP